MKPIWKNVKILRPHCSRCGEMMWGDGSTMNPYTCPEGTWKNTPYDPYEYSLTNTNVLKLRTKGSKKS